MSLAQRNFFYDYPSSRKHIDAIIKELKEKKKQEKIDKNLKRQEEAALSATTKAMDRTTSARDNSMSELQNDDESESNGS